MKITIVYDNQKIEERLISDWGFSCYIEADKKKILFETGGNGRTLLHNLRILDIDPAGITDIVISHPDFDHIGGLSEILNENNTAKLYLPNSFRGVKRDNPIYYSHKPVEISTGFYLTGELDKREQSLGIQTENGIVLVVGCAHPGLERITEVITTFGKVYAIVGGFHGFKKFEVLEDIKKICPTHCTRRKKEIFELFPEKCLEGGAGRILDL